MMTGDLRSRGLRLGEFERPRSEFPRLCVRFSHAMSSPRLETLVPQEAVSWDMHLSTWCADPSEIIKTLVIKWGYGLPGRNPFSLK